MDTVGIGESAPVANPAELTDLVIDWYAEHARALPWRAADCSPWGVLVSEFMLQQTPVSRVRGPWQEWLERWPAPAALAAVPAGEAVRAWGRLGYPRRALRLHAAAIAIVERHDGQVPSSVEELKALPGVGDYTAAAIASFAFGARTVVLDTNVRRVLARSLSGVEFSAPSVSSAERMLAESVLPQRRAATWAAASMELGALVCTASAPACARCPIRHHCAWLQAGRPAYAGPPRRTQGYAGTDRQVRGRLLSVLRDSDGPVAKPVLDLVWNEPRQRERALDSLLADRLAVKHPDGTYGLP